MYKKMLYALLILILSYPLYGGELDKSALFRAMRDELKRTTKRLKIEKKAPPYYVAYRVRDSKKVSIEGNFGAIVNNEYTHDRRLFIDLRVGSYKLDNTNFVAGRSGVRIFGPTGMGTRLPLEDDYDAIRHRIWLATDEVYKDALDNLSKKEATLKHRKIPDRPPDFSKSEPCIQIDSIAELELKREEWAETIKKLSEVFREFPDIQTSKVIFSAEAVNQYFIDSDGSEHRRSDNLAYIEAYAKTQTKDGVSLKDIVGFYARTPDQLPATDIMIASIKGMAETLSVYTKLEKEEEEYCGLVLFTSQAVGEFFYQLLGKGISNPRKPVYEEEMFAALEENEGFLAAKVERKVLPRHFSVYDDPTQAQFNNVPLIGTYTVDDQGVKSAKTDIVKDGKLVEPLMSRTPTKKIKKSNAHARYLGEECVGRLGNLFIKSKKTVKDIESELINLCKERELDYGIVVTKLETPAGKTLEEVIEETFTSFFGAPETKKPLLSSPLVAYKIYTDGRKELVRGIRFEGVTPKSLRDIVNAGESEFVYNFLIREPLGGMMRIFGGEEVGWTLPVSVIAPPVLIDEMTLTAKEAKATELPFVKHPFFER